MTVRALWRGVTFALLMVSLGGVLVGIRWFLGAQHLAALATRVSQLHSQGKYNEALPLAEEYVALTRHGYGEEHPEFAKAALWQGVIYHSQGRSAEAEPLVRRALSIYERTLGPNHRDTGVALNYVAEVYRAQGRYMEAEPIYKRLLPVIEGAFGPDHPHVGALLDSLAEGYRQEDRYAEAEPLYKRSLAIWERALGDSHPHVAASLSSLAQLYHLQGRYAAAEPLYARSLAIREKALGPSDQLVAASRYNLAALYKDRGRYADAEPLYKLLIGEKALGANHPLVAASFNDLAALHFAQQQWATAAAYWRQAVQLMVRRSSLGQDTMDKRSAGQVKQKQRPFRGLVKAVHRIASERPDRAPNLAAEMFPTAQAALRSTVAAYLAQVEIRAAKGTHSLAQLLRERHKLIAEWDVTDKLLVAARFEPLQRPKGEAEALQARLTSAEARISEINRIFARDFADFTALINPRPLTVAEVQARLRADEVLVLFLDTSKIHDVPEETFLWVITKTEMRWIRISLGTEALTEGVATLRCGLDHDAWAGAGLQRCASHLKIAAERAPKGDEPLPFDLAHAHELYRALFGQVEDLVKGKRLLVVPSGPLAALPFHVLVTEAPDVAIPAEAARYANAAWLAKYHAVIILPSVASLEVLRDFTKASMATRPFVGFGNPLLVGPAGSDRRAWERQSCPKSSPAPIHYARQAVRKNISDFFRNGLARVDEVLAQHPIPETADELCVVAELVGASAEAVYLGENATERKIKALSADGTLAQARVVHLATYGLLAGESEALASKKAEPAFILTPPATATDADDGLLTASEIAQLRLDADWVVLSGCNTAAGGSAEALSALAHVFLYAGARTLIVSQWAVNPEATVKLVTGAFGAIKINPGGGRAQALQWSMLALMGSGGGNAHPARWAPFVVVGKARPPLGAAH